MTLMWSPWKLSRATLEGKVEHKVHEDVDVKIHGAMDWKVGEDVDEGIDEMAERR